MDVMHICGWRRKAEPGWSAQQRDTTFGHSGNMLCPDDELAILRPALLSIAPRCKPYMKHGCWDLICQGTQLLAYDTHIAAYDGQASLVDIAWQSHESIAADLNMDLG
jgi:hypothetical protein